MRHIRIWYIMDRVKIREYLINKLREYTDNQYHMAGSYSENVPDIAVILEIINEVEVIGRGNGGFVSYDQATQIETVLYVTSLYISISVYTPLDEESLRICGELHEAILDNRYKIKDNSPESINTGIDRIVSITPPTLPNKREMGQRTSWLSTLQIEVEIKELKTHE